MNLLDKSEGISIVPIEDEWCPRLGQSPSAQLPSKTAAIRGIKGTWPDHIIDPKFPYAGIGEIAMVRQVALFVTTFVVGSFVVYWATASAFGKILNAQPNDARPRYVRGNNCQIEVAGKIIQLQLGQGIETVEGWRNCQAYVGQSFMVYSTQPPTLVVTARGG